MDINQQFSPGLLSFTDQPDFDYGAFLQGEDLGFPESAQGNVASAGGISDDSGKATPPSSDNRSTSNASTELVRRAPAQKQRLERRGHTKSRRGCYNCKRRRIKETRPACGHCTKTGLKCEYPALPQIVHQYEYLMHSLLGFSASQLIASDPSVTMAAMNHRIKAIKAIKKRLAETSNTTISYEEANAMVATCYALTFQSVSLEDGLAEYMTFIRGIMIVGIQMMFRGIKPIFGNMIEQDQDAILEPYMENLPLIQKTWADTALEAVTNLKALCHEQVEIEYQQALVEIVQNLYVNSWDAYKSYTKQYGWWMLLPHNSFQELINPNNQVMILLHAHWVSLNEIMTFITQQERHAREKSPTPREGQAEIDPGFHRWLRYMNAHVDYEHQMYNQWPMWVEDQLNRDITFFGKTM
ncbi:hypothetical protein G7Z17_g6371 [Cylindrodendrum hubeiense]|uniref:Zn(2)-C6 fungal-type domain-containing protein n=1 Tax=Cylindrodendrum hubeiense TaxID=595255 RepID=A0A9P5HAC9_9HYPO|nr:hypothetical protein G7Z17_g6371 [Cylindrodendrum hubeiense]